MTLRTAFFPHFSFLILSYSLSLNISTFSVFIIFGSIYLYSQSRFLDAIFAILIPFKAFFTNVHRKTNLHQHFFLKACQLEVDCAIENRLVLAEKYPRSPKIQQLPSPIIAIKKGLRHSCPISQSRYPLPLIFSSLFSSGPTGVEDYLSPQMSCLFFWKIDLYNEIGFMPMVIGNLR